jgi:hypothetical protein
VEEKCNGKDDDCDGQVDETFPELGQACDGADSDQCADGFWLCADDGSKAVCVELAGPWVEACNGKDDDCDGQVDEGGATGCVEYFLDEDGDGFGGAAKACVCAGLPGYTLVSGDCDDTEGAIHPGAVEACNGHDDDCDGKSDPPDSAGCSIYRKDADMDGYGDASDPGLCLCGPDALYKVSNGLDCNDGNNAVKPGALELCDGMDNDCDGQTDPQGTAGCTSYYKDKDGDGYGDKGQGSQCFCQPQGVFNCLNNLDCDDNAFAVKPGVYEVCDGIDNNCDADVDPEGSLDCQFFYKDADNDGKGDLFTAGKCLCSATPPFSVKNQQDCKDTDPLVPSCEGKQCGDNGCGVSCGTCPGAGPCINFKCGNG